MKFLDFFAGIGGFRLGMEQAGHECLGYVEIDKYARKSYQAMHDTEGEWTATDITKVTDEEWRQFSGTINIICGGFPCQAFSIAGKRLGFEDTRGTLFFEIARAVKQIQPQIIFLENVRGLLSHGQGQTFATILNTLDELGYDAEWQVLNSKDFGVPQNRERVFIIGHSRERSRQQVFPIGNSNKEINQGIESQVNVNTITARYTGNGNGSYVVEGKQIQDVKFADYRYDEGLKFRKDDISPCLHTRLSDDSLSTNIYILENSKIRRLTSLECFRLQGFPDELYEKAKKVNSESQLYKQAGNSVTVNVIYEIAKKLTEGTKS